MVVYEGSGGGGGGVEKSGTHKYVGSSNNSPHLNYSGYHTL